MRLSYNPSGVTHVGGSYAYILFDSCGPMYIGKGSRERVFDSLCRMEMERYQLRKLVPRQKHLKEPLDAIVGCTGCAEHADDTALDLEASIVEHYKQAGVGLANRQQQPHTAALPGSPWQRPELYAKRHTYHLEFLQHMTELMTEKVGEIGPRIKGKVYDWKHASFPLGGGAAPQGTIHWMNLSILEA